MPYAKLERAANRVLDSDNPFLIFGGCACGCLLFFLAAGLICVFLLWLLGALAS